MTYTGLLDANVLYPAPLRDSLLQLAVTDIFKAVPISPCAFPELVPLIPRLSHLRYAGY